MDSSGDIYYEGRRVTDAEITAILTQALTVLGDGFSRGFELRLPPAFEVFQDLSNINRAIEVAVLAGKLGYELRCGG